ncbi:hypothetical protein MRX96_034933 [Rhipicephalus microplus]
MCCGQQRCSTGARASALSAAARVPAPLTDAGHRAASHQPQPPARAQRIYVDDAGPPSGREDSAADNCSQVRSPPRSTGWTEQANKAHRRRKLTPPRNFHGPRVAKLLSPLPRMDCTVTAGNLGDRERGGKCRRARAGAV